LRSSAFLRLPPAEPASSFRAAATSARLPCSAGASAAVTWDVDLYVDYLADCNEPTKGACGEWSSISGIDNVEYIVINNPPAGLYRLKASNFRAP
jgi:hypothetical protein